MRTHLLPTLVLLAACSGGETYVGLDGGDDDIDAAEHDAANDGGDLIDAMPTDGPPPDADTRSWSTPESLDMNTTDLGEGHAKAAPSATELFFGSNPSTSTFTNDIYYVTRTGPSFDWGASRTAVGAVNSTQTETEPVISADGLEMIFRRAATLYTSKRATTTSAWGAPVTTGIDGSMPDILADGLTMYYRDTTATCPVETCRVRVTRSTSSSPWGNPVVESISDVGQYQVVDISGDGLRAMLSGPMSSTTAPIAITTRTTPTGTFGAPVPLSDLALYTGIRWAHWSWDELEMYVGFSSGSNDVYVSRFE